MLKQFFTNWFLALAVTALLAHSGISLAPGLAAAQDDATADGDWPMFRYDVHRSATTPHQLDHPLHLHWVRPLAPPRRAWPWQQDDFEKLAFDASYQPVVADGLMFVGSMTTDSLTAYDLDSGEVRWQYWTDGPVRLAPVVWRGRVYVGSDDGCVHCVDAATGRQIWRFRAAPHPRMVLGNGRVISLWPVRGGPVIADGTLYFAAGIWPNEGVFLYAIDAETAEVRWVNSGSSSDLVEDSKSYFSFGGVSPQGHLVVADDRLIVPGGRTVPAVFDRHTGAKLYYHVAGRATGKAAGGHQVFLHGDWFFNTRDQYVTDMYHVADGAQYGSVHVDLANEQAFIGVEPAGDRIHAYASTVAPTDGHRDPETAEASIGRPIPDAARDTMSRSTTIRGRLERGAIRDDYDLQPLWTAELDGIERLHVQAGSMLYGSGSGGRIFALELNDVRQQPELRWTHRVDGTVFAMLAAGDRLLVVTEEGAIYCFGPQQRETIVHERQSEPLGSARDRWTDRAEWILEQTDVRGGFGLIFGVGSGRLLAELLAQSDMHYTVFEPDPAKVAELRQRYTRGGLYGLRVAVHEGDATSHRLPPYIASLIVAEQPESAGDVASAGLAQAMFHPLRPYGGIAMLVLDDAQQQAFAASVERADLENAELAYDSAAVLLRRPGPLPGSGTWTHQYADAANSAYSDDDRVKAPLGIAWFGTESNHKTLPRHMHGPIPHVVEGRLILLGPNHVSARCVYTGVELWATELPQVGANFTSWEHEQEMALGDRTVYFPNHPGANFIGAPLVSAADSIYVLHDDRCLRLDAATGQQLAEFEMPSPEQLRQQIRDPLTQRLLTSYAARLHDGQQLRWGNIRYEGDFLIAAAYPHMFDDRQPGREKNWNATSSEFLVVMDRHTGQIRWVQQARYGFRHNAIAAGGGKVFAIDNLSEEILQILDRRGIEPGAQPAVVAMDLASGELLWTYREDVFGTSLSYSAAHDVLAQSGHPGRRAALPDEPRDRLVVLQGATGELLWADSVTQRRAPLGMHDALGHIVGSSGEGAADLLTGQPLTQCHPLTGQQVPWTWIGAIRCGTQNFSRHLALFRSGAAAFAELDGWPTTANVPGVRPGCTNSLVVADGMFHVPDYSRTCSCSYQHQTSFGLVHMPEVEMWTYNAMPDPEAGGIRRVGLNLGAPASRLDRASETLWLEYPPQVIPAPEVPVQVETEDDAIWFHQHSSIIQQDNGGHRWVAASGVEGVRRIRIGGLATESETNGKLVFQLRLHFAELEAIEPGQRIFDVAVQGQRVLDNFDVVDRAGGRNRVVVAQFETSPDADGNVEVALESRDGSLRKPLLCGIEVRAVE